MKLTIFLILSIFSHNFFCQDYNQEFSLKGIKEFVLEVNLQIDNDLKNIVKTDESVYLQEIRYLLSMAGIKNKSVNSLASELPVLTLSVLFRKSRGGIDVISKLHLTQKLYFSNAKMKLGCITWTGNENIISIVDNWSKYYDDVLIESIVDNAELFVADYLEVNSK